VGVTVTCEGNSTFTDVTGAYKLPASSSKSKIVFTSIGLSTQSIEIGNKRVIDVVMKDDTQKLDEVVVNIGYGTQKRGNVTGSISKLKSDKIENAPVVRLDQALQGKIAGVTIQNIASEAGSDPKIQVRGISSINAGASPLIVVDGQPIPDGFASINSQDVESVEVLKDAASAAIYGSRGASGVILITTKSGKSDKARYTFKNSIGFKDAYETHPMLSSSDYVELLYKERALKLLDPTVPSNQLGIPNNFQAQYFIEQNLLGGQGTDYQDEVLRTALYRDIQFSVSGGNKDVKYFISSGYQQEEGLMLNSDSERLNFRAKVDVALSKKVKLQVNLNPSHTKTQYPGPGYTDFYRFATFLPKVHTAATAAFVNQNPQYANIQAGDIAEATHFFDLQYTGNGPDGTPFNVNTRPFNTTNVNPLGSLNKREENRNQFRFQGSTNLTFQITKDLDFKTTANIYHRNTDRLNWAGTNATRFNSPNQAQYIRETFFDFLTENTFTYKKEIGNHNFDALAGYTYQSTEANGEQITANSFPTDNIQTLTNAGSINQALTFGTKEKIGLQSFLGRVNYNYKGKYLLMASYRTDGSSLFAEGKRWGGFPAASAGWIISKENFMANISQINKLGLRASYGVSGNNRIATFSFQDKLGNSGYSLGTGNGAVVLGQASITDVAGNNDITWERTFQTNFGVDLIAFNNRITVSVDAYQSLTDQLLLEQPTQLFTGTQRFFTNVGSLKNKGLEVELGINLVKTKIVNWNVSLNASRVRNEIDNLGAVDLIRSLGERNEIYQNKVGNPLVQFFGYKTDGIWTSQAEIDAAVAGGLTTSNIQNALIPGGLKIVDVSGPNGVPDNVLDENDRTVLGDPYPDFTWGFTNNLSVGNFNLGFTLQGVKGGSVYNGDANYNEFRQRNTNFNSNRWISAANPGDGKTPYETVGVQWMLTDYLLEDASYASLREVNLAYNFNKESLKSFGLSGLKFFLSGQNLYYVMANGYRGINPESRNSSSQYSSPLVDGYQRGGYPIPRTIIFGIEVNF
jgi:TonB-linked SusC/RagA family outer membrane protein